MSKPSFRGLHLPYLAPIQSANSKYKCNAACSSTTDASVTSLTVGSTRTKMLRIFAG